MRRSILFVSLTLLASTAPAEEGMWPLNGFPSGPVKDKYGFVPTQDWLDHVRLSSVRLAEGCSASFVSPGGLIMTNHHCAHECIEQLSSVKRDYVKDGFYAKRLADEARCPQMEANELIAITDVTARIAAATKGKSGEAWSDAEKGEMSRIEKACATSENLRCDVVTLYHGGRYDLYAYRRWQDVRLVFAPELAIAFFGGDPDNFDFPRFDYDVAFVRAYEDGKPARTENYFRWSASGAQEGETTFVPGHPGRTSRLLSVAELAYERDVALPRRVFFLAEKRGLLTMFQTLGIEPKRISTAELFYVENALKALKGRLQALADPKFFGLKVSAQEALVRSIRADPKLAGAYVGAFPMLAKAIEDYRAFDDAHIYLEGTGRQGPWAFDSVLFDHARQLVRAADELAKPSDQRLREYTDANLPALKQELFTTAPIHDQLEVVKLTYSLTKLREQLGADEPIVHRVLGPQSPSELATRLLKGTKLRDLKERQRLFDGGKAAIAASKDPLILFAQAVDPDARALRKRYDDTIAPALRQGGEQLAKARFALHGMNEYPDATFTLRISYGQVKGWSRAGRSVSPFTTIGGAFARATGREPFALPDSWTRAKLKLDPTVPFNFVTNNDIIGGNSGSPVVNRNGEVVGLVFDGNLESLGGDFGFDESVNRTVALDSRAITHVLYNVYGAVRVADELLNPQHASLESGAR